MAGSKGVLATLLVLMLLIVGGGLGYVYYDHGNADRLNLSGSTYTYTLIGLGVLAFLLFILLIVVLARRAPQALFVPTGQRSSEVEFEQLSDAANTPAVPAGEPDPRPAGYGQGPEVVVYDLPVVEKAYRSWSSEEKGPVFTYPRSVPAAIYSNDTVELGNGQALKMRTLVAGPADVGPIPETQAAPSPVSLGPQDVPEPYRSKLFGPDPSNAITKAPVDAEGDGFVAQLAEARAAPRARAASVRAYYGYPGDVHPVEDIEGIGTIYGEKLRKVGVYTTDRLCYEDAGRLADKVGVPAKTVETWKHMSELVKVKGVGPQYAEAMARAGINGIADLKRRSAAGIAEQVTTYLDSLQATVVGQAITEKRVEGWQKAAAKLKRVRLQVPEN